MFIYLMVSKILYPLMNWETFNFFMTEVHIIQKPVH